ncbi:hypothetical protein L3Q67_01550 [Saccharothrix sp. AJ9571]|nr:hypothetical protein L3Q67_01550 [Saccharothrix sp. AJ9571]
MAFLRRSPLTDGIGALEHALVSADAHRAREVAHDAGLTEELLRSALIVRRDVGRVSDVIHATVIALALPAVLEEGERVVQRPSLGPGNDPARTFDLETNMRVAQVKVAVCRGVSLWVCQAAVAAWAGAVLVGAAGGVVQCGEGGEDDRAFEFAVAGAGDAGRCNW